MKSATVGFLLLLCLFIASIVVGFQLAGEVERLKVQVEELEAENNRETNLKMIQEQLNGLCRNLANIGIFQDCVCTDKKDRKDG